MTRWRTQRTLSIRELPFLGHPGVTAVREEPDGYALIAATGWKALFGLAMGFLLAVWVLAALRNLVGGYRDP